MDDKKIQARNKFVGKINQKIEKLNEDIKLLIEVDKALNTQTGGGLLTSLNAAISSPPSTVTSRVDYGALDTKAQELTRQLEGKIKTLEDTLGLLLSHITSRSGTAADVTADANKLNGIDARITAMDSDLDLKQLAAYKTIFEKYTQMANIDLAAYKREYSSGDFASVSPQVKELLHKAIESKRTGEAKRNPASFAWN